MPKDRSLSPEAWPNNGQKRLALEGEGLRYLPDRAVSVLERRQPISQLLPNQRQDSIRRGMRRLIAGWISIIADDVCRDGVSDDCEIDQRTIRDGVNERPHINGDGSGTPLKRSMRTKSREGERLQKWPALSHHISQ